MSSFISKTMKSTAIINLSTSTSTSSNTPHGCLMVLSANYKVILVLFNLLNPSYFATVKRITLAPTSHRALENSILLIVQSIEKLPNSFNLGGSLFCIRAVHSLVRAII